MVSGDNWSSTYYLSCYSGRANELGHPEAAISDYDAAIRLNPEYAKAYNNRGVAKKALGHLEAAISDYDAAIRLDPNNAAARTNLENAQKELRERQKET